MATAQNTALGKRQFLACLHSPMAKSQALCRRPAEGYEINAHFNQVSAEGLEPSANGLKGHCSTIELRAR